MIVRPNGDQYVAMSTLASPVTHTALVAVNNASRKFADWPDVVAAGILSSVVMMRITAAKAASARRAGVCKATRLNQSVRTVRRDQMLLIVLLVSGNRGVHACAVRGRRHYHYRHL